MIELFLIPAMLFLAMVVFYRQRRPELSILQIEQNQIESQLPDLLEEQQPVVLRGVAPPKGLTLASLKSIQRLQGFPVGGVTLHAILENPSLLASSKGMPTLTKGNRILLAEELSFPIWAAHTWQQRLAETRLTSFLGSMQTEAVLGGLGLHRTTAIYTLVFPTEGEFVASIVSKDTEAFLPKSWPYRYVDSFTQDDTPLVSELKYLDIILRPGTALCLPPHMIVSLRPKTPDAFHAFAFVEYHEPISTLAKSFT